MTEATNLATYGTSCLLTSEARSQFWWRSQIRDRNFDKQACFLGCL